MKPITFHVGLVNIPSKISSMRDYMCRDWLRWTQRVSIPERLRRRFAQNLRRFAFIPWPGAESSWPSRAWMMLACLHVSAINGRLFHGKVARPDLDNCRPDPVGDSSTQPTFIALLVLVTFINLKAISPTRPGPICPEGRVTTCHPPIRPARGSRNRWQSVVVVMPCACIGFGRTR